MSTFEPIDVGHPDANRTINLARAKLDDSPPAWWYLSFVDPDLAPPPDQQEPGGPSWLGACYVKAPNVPMAVTEAHRLGCNPGGEVATYGPFTDEDMDENVPADQRNRKAAPHLLDRVDEMLAMYERRQTTNVPGTVSLIRDLAATLRAEMKGWANARGDAVDYSLRAGELESIVRDLAECRINAATPEALSVARERASDWVSAHPVSTEPESPAMCKCGHDLGWHSRWNQFDQVVPCDHNGCECEDFDRVSAHPVSETATDG